MPLTQQQLRAETAPFRRISPAILQQLNDSEEGHGWDDWDWTSADAPAFLCPYISLSHDAEYMVCASTRAFAVFKAGEEEYELCSPIVNAEDGDKITSILCLPMFVPSNVKSRPTEVAISVIIGHQSGYFKIYSEEGTLLISHLLNLTPVISIKLRTIGSLKSGDADEILIIYGDKKAVSVDGPSLWMAIRLLTEHKRVGESLDQPALIYKKWAFESEETLDIVSYGPSSNTRLASPAFNPVSGHFASTQKSARFVGVGRPIVRFYGTSEASQSHSLKSVASKVSNAMFSFAKSIWTHTPLGPRYPPPPPQQTTTLDAQLPDDVAPPITIPTLCTLTDPHRCVTSITPSPGNNRSPLAALTDSLGRVMCLDVEEGEIVRIFKGMRDAQCGWIQACVDSRTILVLVMYTGRGVCEIYRPRHGHRIAGFQIGPGAKLVQTTGCVLGAVYRGGISTSELAASCFIVGPGGEIRRINVTATG